MVHQDSQCYFVPDRWAAKVDRAKVVLVEEATVALASLAEMVAQNRTALAGRSVNARNRSPYG